LALYYKRYEQVGKDTKGMHRKNGIQGMRKEGWEEEKKEGKV